MTDSPTPAEPGPVDPDVELASAHLDEEAGADERARVEDARVRAHVVAFAEVAERVRDVPRPPPGLVDDHVTTALAAFDREARVVPLGGSRATPWWQRIPLGAVAAGLVIVALIIGIATTTAGDDDTDTAATALDAGDEGTDSADDDASAGAMEESTALDTEQFDAAGGRAAYDSYDALATGLEDELAAAPDSAEGPVAESDVTSSERGAGDGVGDDPCGAVGLLDLDPADVVLVRAVVVGPDDVTAVVHDSRDGRRLTVVDDASCTVVLDRPL